MSLWERIRPVEAEIVRRFMKDTPVRVGEMAAALGLKVFRSPLPPKISGLIRPVPGEGETYEIRVNKYEVPERQRFTLAHEIAHFLIHKEDIRGGVVDSVMYRSALSSRKEAEANRLAAEIVMPLVTVRAHLAQRGGTATEEVAQELAGIFRVSLPAMKVRLGIS